MRIHRVYTPQALESGRELILEGGNAHYLARVLRVNAGQTVVLFNGDGRDYAAEVVRADRKEISLRLFSRLPAAAESAVGITVVQALSRGERMDQTLQKCTELGASAFQPLISERVEVRLDQSKLAKRLAHWQGVVISACEQSGRAVIPQVHEPLDLEELLARPATGLSLVLAPGAPEPLARAPLGRTVQVLIGPEGGFSEAEQLLMQSRGMQLVSLGPRILRTETAAPAAVAIVQALAGDLG
ncbi:MAG: 16S rRNA (uracil(1498)-N(3))-methyltransferase [Xanthomonadales bacterium]|nr:16S rRNA (uracil(1498)-N(3))-methyltransferase [Gammaproteobacteria bacterium]MBT8054276.1 16S rRNA (uracil(1498)-N(3))-methyltransferase [Gammaproteobacteria bacterium]NND57531.1 16S rRNA (uracil(1498)-N(3))-methyltransferase [Xanthomonadales bacterium]NNK51255.1 16S rRNA (uracil(1498)-N(3))-methyltransferase [Xanthomonadales bacterium]